MEYCSGGNLHGFIRQLVDNSDSFSELNKSTFESEVILQEELFLRTT